MSFFAILCLLCVSLPLSQAAPLPHRQPFHTRIFPRTTERRCGFEGNADIYGLGIRLGLYLQWLSAYVTRHLLPEAVPDLAGITFIFEFALIVAAVVLTKSVDTTYSIELVILIAMLLGDTWLVHVPIYFPYHSNHHRPRSSLVSLLSRNIMMAVIAVFSIWYSVLGYGSYRQDPCGTYVFFFEKLPNPSSKVTAQGLLIGVACSGFIYLVILNASRWSPVRWSRLTSLACEEGLTSVKSIARIILLPLEEFDLEEETCSNSHRDPHWTLKIVALVKASVLPFAMAMMISGIELMVKWNSIKGTYSIQSTGQLIPLVLGAGSLFRVFSRVFVKHLAQSDPGSAAPPRRPSVKSSTARNVFTKTSMIHTSAHSDIRRPRSFSI